MSETAPLIHFGLAPKQSYSILPEKLVGVHPSIADNTSKPVAVLQPKYLKWPDIVRRYFASHKVVKSKALAPNIVWVETEKTFEGKPIKGKKDIELTIRRNSNVVSISALWLDLDDTDIGYDLLLDGLSAVGWNFALYTTISYDPSKQAKQHKYRIVLPLSEPIEVKQLKVAVAGAAELIGVPIDEWDRASTVPAQLMFLPSKLSGGKSKLDTEISGEYADPLHLLDAGRRALQDDQNPDSASGGRGITWTRPEDIEEGDRHRYLTSIMRRRAGEHLDRDEVFEELTQLNTRFKSPLNEEQLHGLERVWSSFWGGDVTFGFTELLRRLNELRALDTVTESGAKTAGAMALKDKVAQALHSGELSMAQLDALISAGGGRGADRLFTGGVWRQEVLAAVDTLNLGGGNFDAEMAGSDEALGDGDAEVDELMGDFGELIDGEEITGSRGERLRGRTDFDLLRHCVGKELGSIYWLLGDNNYFNIDTMTAFPVDGFRGVIKRANRKALNKAMEMRDGLAARLGLVNQNGAPLVPLDFAVDHKIIKSVQTMDYAPGLDSIFKYRGNARVNTYIAPPWLGSDKLNLCKPIFKHWEWMIPDPQERGVIMWLLAHFVQYPERRVEWVPILTGGQGVGKNMLFTKVISRLLGSGNFSAVGETVWNSSYRLPMFQAQVVEWAEFDAIKPELAESLKADITGEMYSAGDKNVKVRQGVNRTSFVATSNKVNPIKLESGDRRYAVITCRRRAKYDSKAKLNAYYGRLDKLIDNDDVIEALYEWALTYKHIDRYSPHVVPHTATTQEVMEATEGSFDRVCRFLAGSKEFRTDGVYSSQLMTSAVKRVFGFFDGERLDHDMYESGAWWEDIGRAGSKRHTRDMISALETAGFMVVEKEYWTGDDTNPKTKRVWLHPTEELSVIKSKLNNAKKRESMFSAGRASFEAFCGALGDQE